MKRTLILGLAITALNPFVAFAADDQYPASNFQPSVVYMDEQLANSSASASASSSQADSKYPAANFTPTVIYSDESAATSSTVAAQSVEDPKYPAANFQPKIIYP